MKLAKVLSEQLRGGNECSDSYCSPARGLCSFWVQLSGFRPPNFGTAEEEAKVVLDKAVAVAKEDNDESAGQFQQHQWTL